MGLGWLICWATPLISAVAEDCKAVPRTGRDSVGLLQVEVAVERVKGPQLAAEDAFTNRPQLRRWWADRMAPGALAAANASAAVGPPPGRMAAAPNATEQVQVPGAVAANASAGATEEVNETGWCGYQAHDGFMKAYTKPGSDNLLLDLTEAFQGNNSVRFVVTAMSISGTYMDGSGYLAEYAAPMEETSNTMFEFRLGSDNISVDVYKPELDLRTSDKEMVAALKRGTGSGRFESLSTFRCARRSPGNFLRKGSESKAPLAMSLMARERSLVDLALAEHNAMQEVVLSQEVEKEEGNITTIREGVQQVIINGGTLIRAGFFVAPSLKEATSYRLLSVKVFRGNLDVAVEYLMSDGMPLSIGFSLVSLPETPMQPRTADDRLLYFTTDYVDLGEHGRFRDELPEESVNRKVSTIWRYNLAALPGQQIRIHIDPTVPKRWRKWFRLGVEAWNEAFKLIGQPKAVRAVLPEDQDWPRDYDVSDARFSTISWTVSQEVVSMGIAKVDPRSGEILKSDIIMSDGWVRSWLGDLDLLAPNFTHQLRESTGFRFEARLDGNVILGRRRIPGRLRIRDDRSNTDSDWGKKISLLALAAGKQLETPERDEILGKGLQNVVTHETGHILGLRHNFKGSLGVTYACVRSPSCSSVNGITASVMDYVPVNLPSADAPDVHLFTPVLGAYDKLAIQYGYMEVNSSIAESNMSVASQSALEAGLQAVLREAEQFETCYDADRIAQQDPSCVAYDISSDPLEAYEDEIRRLADVQLHLLNSSVMPGAPYTLYGDAVDTVLMLARSTGVKLVDWLGGVSNSYVHRRMNGAPPDKPARSPVPAHVQRRALALLVRLLRPAKVGLLPPEDALPYLVAAPRGSGSVGTVNLEARVRSIARSLMSAALQPEQLLRMYAQERLAASMPANEQDSNQGALTCGEYLAKLVAGVVGDGGLATYESSEWDLHRLLASGLADLHQSSSLPGDVRAHALHHLLRLYREAEAAAQSHFAPAEQAAAADKGPQQYELLQAHLASLRQQLAAGACGEHLGRACPMVGSGAAPAPAQGLGIAGTLVMTLWALACGAAV